MAVSVLCVKGVVTFYTLFNKEPVGKHQVWVCRTLSCALRGSDEILHHCEKRLGITPGQTTKDGKVTLSEASAAALKHFDEVDTNHDKQVMADERRAFHAKKHGGMTHQ